MMAMAITGYSENQADPVLIKESFAIESEAKFELNRPAYGFASAQRLLEKLFMPSKQLNVISHCAKSPWFSRTWSENALYGEYAGRLVLLSLGNDTVEEYWKLRKSVGLFDVPERPVEIRGRDAVKVPQSRVHAPGR